MSKWRFNGRHYSPNQNWDCCFFRRRCLKPEYPWHKLRGGGGGFLAKTFFGPFGPQFGLPCIRNCSEKNLFEQGRELKTNLTHIKLRGCDKWTRVTSVKGKCFRHCANLTPQNIFGPLGISLPRSRFFVIVAWHPKKRHRGRPFVIPVLSGPLTLCQLSVASPHLVLGLGT